MNAPEEPTSNVDISHNTSIDLGWWLHFSLWQDETLGWRWFSFVPSVFSFQLPYKKW
jgi:hypothetical protein